MSLSNLLRSFEEHARHCSPFLVLGDPTPELSVALAVTAIDAGATMLELGIPFSDPCADGVAVQEAVGRARAAGVSTLKAFEILSRIHSLRPEVPLNLLVYGNLIHALGYDPFCRQAAQAGASSLLAPDIPLEEGAALERACARHDLGLVHMVAPSTSTGRLRMLDERATGFLYATAYQGVTGHGAAQRNSEDLRRLARVVQRPLCLGFGLSEPDHLIQAFEGGAQLCVVGSHLCRAIKTGWEGTGRSLGAFDTAPGIRVIQTFKEALKPLIQAASDAPSARAIGRSI